MSSPQNLGTRKREQQEQSAAAEKENEASQNHPCSGDLGSKRQAVDNRGGQLTTAVEQRHDSQEVGSWLSGPLLTAAPTAASATGTHDGSPKGQADEGSPEHGPSQEAAASDPQPPERPAPPPPPRRFAPRAFYGSRLQQAAGGTGGSRQQASEERVLRFLRAVHRRLDGPEEAPPWLIFPTQQPAFDAADAQPGLEVFSVEHGERGRRCFVATTRSEFWRRYREMLPAHRHWYEIIREGAPCHLYFGALPRRLLNFSYFVNLVLLALLISSALSACAQTAITAPNPACPYPYKRISIVRL